MADNYSDLIPSASEINTEKHIYRVVFSRKGPAIWLGHLDMMRTFERSIRRAGIPVAWSQGFNPRPQIVFALPISVGMAAQADLLDIVCEHQVKAAELAGRLSSFLPEGIQAIRSEEVFPGRESLMSLVCKARYRLETPGISAAAQTILATDQPLLTEKTRKGKTSQIDIRPLLQNWQIENDNSLVISVLAGSSRNLRPDLLLKLLVEQGGLDQLAADDAMITRLELILSA